MLWVFSQESSLWILWLKAAASPDIAWTRSLTHCIATTWTHKVTLSYLQRGTKILPGTTSPYSQIAREDPINSCCELITPNHIEPGNNTHSLLKRVWIQLLRGRQNRRLITSIDWTINDAQASLPEYTDHSTPHSTFLRCDAYWFAAMFQSKKLCKRFCMAWMVYL